jgi:hypothetical protein
MMLYTGIASVAERKKDADNKRKEGEKGKRPLVLHFRRLLSAFFWKRKKAASLTKDPCVFEKEKKRHR